MVSLEELSDRVEIEDLLNRYTTAVDVGEWELLDGVFSPDARIDYTSSGGCAGGPEEMKRWLEVALRQIPIRQHLLGGKAVTIDGDRASVRAYFFAPILRGVGDGPRQYAPGGGYYHVRLERRQEGWRIVELREEEVWREGCADLVIPMMDDVK